VAAREEAESILLEADFGVAATAEIVEQVGRTPGGDARRALEQAVVSILSKAGAPGALARASEPPTVMLVFGVNGVGKTTTIAKLAHRLVRDGRSVLLAAADTFRAGAREQLEIWANRLGVPCTRGRRLPRRCRSPASSSRSSTGPRRAGAWSPCSASSPCRFVLSAPAKGSKTSKCSTLNPTPSAW